MENRKPQNTILGVPAEGGENTATTPVFAASSNTPEPRFKRGLKKAGFGVLAAMILIGGAMVVIRGVPQAPDQTPPVSQSFDPVELPLEDLVSVSQLGTQQGQTLSVNGQLRANNSVVIAPTAQPNKPSRGHLYYDQTTNQLAYFNGTEFVVLTKNDVTQQQLTLLQNQITTVAGQTPEIPDLPDDLASTSVSNTFTALNTFANGINASALTVTGSSTMGPTTMSSLILNSPLSVASGGTGATSLTVNGVLVGQGSGAVTSLAAGLAGQCLVSTAGAPIWTNCAGAAVATLQQAYDASIGGTTPEIKLDVTRGALDIQDANSTLGAALFNIRASNAGGLGTSMFSVGNTGAIIAQNAVNSATAFSIRNAAGTTTAFNVDTTATNAITLGTNTDLLLQGATAYISNSHTRVRGEAFGAGADMGNDSVAVGYNAFANGGDNNVAIGSQAINNSTSGVSIGYSAASGFDAVAVGADSDAAQDSVAIGESALAAQQRSVAIGAGATTNNNQGIAIGNAATATGTAQLVIGGSTANAGYVTEGYFGSGVTDATPQNFVLQGTGGSGNNIQGASFTLAGGRGTGTGNGGNLNFQIADAGGAGSTLNPLSTVASLSGVNGAALFQNSTDSLTAFRVQNAAGSSTIFDVDTSNNRVGILTSAPRNDLDLGRQGAGITIGQDNAVGNGGHIGFGSVPAEDGIYFGGNDFNFLTDQTNGFKFFTDAGSDQLTPEFSLTNDGSANFRSNYNSATSFLLQNAEGNRVLQVDNRANNLIYNPSIEVTPFNGWSYTGTAGGSVALYTTTDYVGDASLQINTNGGIGDGAKQTLGTTLNPSTTYVISFHAYGAAFSGLTVAYAYDGTTQSNCTNQNTTQVNTVGWNHIFCRFTTGSGATAPTAANAVIIKQTDAATRSFLVDAIQMNTGFWNAAYQFETARVENHGLVWAGPFNVQANNASNSTFQIQGFNGNITMNVDTLQGFVGIGTEYARSALDIADGAITIDGTTMTSYVSPQGSPVSTKINIPNFNPGNFNQILAMGLPAGASTSARVLSIFDNRAAGNNQPPLNVFSPDESSLLGLSWDGQNTYGFLKVVGNHALGFKTNGNNIFSLNADQNTGKAIFANNVNSTDGFSVRQSDGLTKILSVDTSNAEVEFGHAAGVTGTAVFHNTINTNTTAIQSSVTSASYITALPTAIGSAGDCLQVASVAGSTQTLGYTACSGSGGTLQAAYDAGNTITTTDARNIAFTLANTATGSDFIVNMQDNDNEFQIQNNGTTTAHFDRFGSLLANTTVGGGSDSTTAAGTNTTTIPVAGGSFGDNTIIRIDNAGQDYYTRIVSGGGTNTWTVSPAVSFDNGATISNTNIAPNIGASNLNYTNLSDRFFQGYFLGGVVAGTGTTTLSDGRLHSTGRMNFNSADYLFQNSTDSTTAFQIQNAAANRVFNVDTTNTRTTIANAAYLTSAAASGHMYSQNVNSTTDELHISSNVFGRSTVASQTDSNNDNWASANKHNSGSGGTIEAIYVYFTAAASAPNNKVRVAIYSDSSNAPNTLLANSDLTNGAGTTITTNTWTRVPLTAPYTLSANTNYWLTFSTNDNANAIAQDWYGAGVSKHDSGNDFDTGPAFPGTFTVDSTDDFFYSMYAPYTTVGDEAYITSGLTLSQNNNLTVKPLYDFGAAFKVQSADGTRDSLYVDAYSGTSFFNSGQSAGLNDWETGQIQLGGWFGPHLIMDNDSILVQNTGVASTLNVQEFGGGLSSRADTNTFRSTNDTTSLLQVQNAAGASLLNVDSTDSNITLAGNNTGKLGAFNATSTISAREGAGTVTVNGYIYELGGCDTGSNPTNTVQYAKVNADGTLGTWATTTTLPTASCNGAAATYNGFIYMTGGTGVAGTSEAIYYARPNADGTISSWTTSSTIMPDDLIHHGLVAYNGYLYAIGGEQENFADNENAYYARLNADGSVSGFTTQSNWMGAAAGQLNMGIAVANGYLYMVGGREPGFPTNEVRYAKINANGSLAAHATTAVLTSPKYAMATVVQNGYIYALGGDSPTNTVYYAQLNANGTVGSWATNTNTLPGNRAAGGAVALNGYVYFIGGFNTPAQNNAWYASGTRVKLGASLDLVGLSGENLNEGGSGGSLTAGNTHIAGTLTVTDMAQFLNSASVLRDFSVGKDLAVTGQSVLGGGTDQTQLVIKSNASQSLANPQVSFIKANGDMISQILVDYDTGSQFFGYQSGDNIQAGGLFNVAFGPEALESVTTGGSNTAVGLGVLNAIVTGGNNVAVGTNAAGAVTGDNNVAIGSGALTNPTDVYSTVAIGRNAGNITGAGGTGPNFYLNTFIGDGAGNDGDGDGFATIANNLQRASAIGNNAQVQASNTMVLGAVDQPQSTRVVVGSTMPISTNLFGVSPIYYDTGTASQSTTTITGAGGATFTSAMIGMRFIFANGTDGGIITAVPTSSTLTVTNSQTVASQNYRIHNTGFQVTNEGNAYIQSDSTAAFKVQNAAGNNLINANTSGNVVTFGGRSATISPVNAWQANGVDRTTLAVSPAAIGNILIFAMYGDSGKVASITGGGVTAWHKVTSGTVANLNMYYGRVTSTGASTITISYDVNPGTTTELVAGELNSALGASTAWVVGPSGTQANSGTTVTYPSLTSPSAGSAYFGYTYDSSFPAAGSTPGFTYTVTAMANMYIYNTSLAAGTAYAPTHTQSGSGASRTIGAIFSAYPTTEVTITNGSSAYNGDVTVNGNLTLSAGKSLTVTGGSGTFPGGAVEGQIYYRTENDQLYVYTGSKWQADRSTATKIVAASDSQNKEKADYVGDGTSDETEINQAISDLPAAGGTVVLLEGNYSIDGSINVDASTKIVGQGQATTLNKDWNQTSANVGLFSIYSDKVYIGDMRLIGNKATYTNSNNIGIYKDDAYEYITVNNVIVYDFAGHGIQLDGTAPDDSFGHVISNNRFIENGGDAVKGDYTDKSSFIGNNFSGNNVGISLEDSNGGGISGNSFDNNSIGVYTGGSDNIGISGNNFIGNDTGIFASQFGLSISGNSFSNSGLGIEVAANSDQMSITGNTFIDGTGDVIVTEAGGNIHGLVIDGNHIGYNAGIAIYLSSNVDGSIISDNRIDESGASSSDSAVYLGDADNTQITGNKITDSAGTGYAIDVTSGSGDTYLADNTYQGTGAASINDAASDTIYANQQDANGRFRNTNLFIEDKLTLGVDARTIADNGGGTNATLTLTPNSSYVKITCNDAQGCDITMGEGASVVEGDTLVAVTATGNVNWADTTGVSELNGAFNSQQYDSITMLYITDRWVETARSNN